MKLYLLLGSFLAFLWNLAPTSVDFLRETSVKALLVAWPGKNALKQYFDDRPWRVRRDPLSVESTAPSIEETLGSEDSEFLQKKWGHLQARLQEELLSFPGEVIQRDPSSWTSAIWINVGHFDNRALGKEIISKNSPVLAQGALVGLVEYVGERQSRVRLLTDAGFIPAVRVVRGGLQNRELAAFLYATESRLRLRDDLFSSQEEKIELISQLAHLFQLLGGPSVQENLAKGELHGSSSALWHVRGPLLKGIGFNYDFADEQGPARDLRTGRPLGVTDGAWTPLIQKGDLLVTSGLDGLFPPNLPVALVERVLPAKEGAHSYDIEAFPAAHGLNDLRTVFVLPAIE